MPGCIGDLLLNEHRPKAVVKERRRRVDDRHTTGEVEEPLFGIVGKPAFKSDVAEGQSDAEQVLDETGNATADPAATSKEGPGGPGRWEPHPAQPDTRLVGPHSYVPHDCQRAVVEAQRDRDMSRRDRWIFGLEHLLPADESVFGDGGVEARALGVPVPAPISSGDRDLYERSLSNPWSRSLPHVDQAVSVQPFQCPADGDPADVVLVAQLACGWKRLPGFEDAVVDRGAQISLNPLSLPRSGFHVRHDSAT